MQQPFSALFLNTSSSNPDNRVEMHGASRVDSTLGSNVCWVITMYQPGASAPRPANTDLTFCTKPRDPPWIPFSSSPAPPFYFKIYSPMVEERRWMAGWWGCWGGEGLTVRQLFTVVLSSYFTWKQGHSFLNSSSWPISSYVWDAFLHRNVYCVPCPPFTLLRKCIQTFLSLSPLLISPKVYISKEGTKILVTEDMVFEGRILF